MCYQPPDVVGGCTALVVQDDEQMPVLMVGVDFEGAECFPFGHTSNVALVGHAVGVTGDGSPCFLTARIGVVALATGRVSPRGSEAPIVDVAAVVAGVCVFGRVGVHGFCNTLNSPVRGLMVGNQVMAFRPVMVHGRTSPRVTSPSRSASGSRLATRCRRWSDLCPPRRESSNEVRPGRSVTRRWTIRICRL